MELTIRGRNLEITEGLRDTIKKNLSKLERHISENVPVSVSLRCDKKLCTTEIMMVLKGKTVRAEAEGYDMYATIDEAEKIIERRLDKYRETLYESKRRSAAEKEDADSAEVDDAAEERKPIRVKRFGIKPMFPEDAVLEMELLGHDFFVFANADEDCEVNVVYRRKKGGYGLIEPEFD